MNVSTHARVVVKQLEYVEETTPGTMPTNPTMNFLAQVAKWTPDFMTRQPILKIFGPEG